MSARPALFINFRYEVERKRRWPHRIKMPDVYGQRATGIQISLHCKYLVINLYRIFLMAYISCYSPCNSI